MNWGYRGRVDKDRLDEEWIDFEEDYNAWAEKSVKVAQELLLAEDQLEVAYSQADKMIRDNPAKYKMESVTEAAVKARVRLHKLVTEAEEKVKSLKSSKIAYEAKLKTLDNRKKALENLIVLFGKDYFSRPRVSAEANGRAKEYIEKARTAKAFGGKSK